jgi:hypothetical protein
MNSTAESRSSGVRLSQNSRSVPWSARSDTVMGVFSKVNKPVRVIEAASLSGAVLAARDDSLHASGTTLEPQAPQALLPFLSEALLQEFPERLAGVEAADLLEDRAKTLSAELLLKRLGGGILGIVVV